jgi:NIMA (never in mitosis gene a)-related kinase
VWRDEPYDVKSDIWSLGCIIYEMAALKPPFRAKDMEGLYQKVQKGVFERIPTRYTDDLQKIIALCLQTNSSMRPSCKQLLSNSIVKKNTQALEVKSQEILDYELEENQNLLQTIKVPKNMKNIQSALPKAKYDNS